MAKLWTRIECFFDSLAISQFFLCHRLVEADFRKFVTKMHCELQMSIWLEK